MEDEKSSGFMKPVIAAVVLLLVAVLSSATTLVISFPLIANMTDSTPSQSKLEELQTIIEVMYIAEVDSTALEDAAAAAMVAATGDRWSYYIPASKMQDYVDTHRNEYVGIGVSIEPTPDGTGILVLKVEPGTPAQEGGILPGDVIVAVDGTTVAQAGWEAASDMVSGKVDTPVDITVSRDGAEQTLTLTRAMIRSAIVTGRMVTPTIGYIQIENFLERSAQDTIAMIDNLEEQGATSIIFDVRFNPGGYKDEMVDILDYLLPEGVLFRAENFAGSVKEDTSDASCKDLSVAVLINAQSYSAAEFFAAALVEYEYGVTVGQATTGKGYFQQALPLSDGSAVNLSIGQYFTPNGVNLAEVGGLVPDYPVEMDEETAAAIYSDLATDEEDLQLQEAIRVLSTQ